jgi:peptide/nickel transport system permease protein
LVIVVLVLLFCFVGPLVYKTNQVDTDSLNGLQPPGHGHPLGTDALGYDTLGRLMIAGQSSLTIGVAAALLAALFGAIWGATSGYVGGTVDSVMMRIVDTLVAVPSLLLAIVVAALVSPSATVLILLITFTQWMNLARLVRAEALSIREREYVEAAEVVGASKVRVISRHILPNALGTIMVQTSLEVANAILTLSALSYLGLGIQAPATDWGAMLSDGLRYIYEDIWWLTYPAGLVMVGTVIAFNLIGEGLRDMLEVRIKAD